MKHRALLRGVHVPENDEMAEGSIIDGEHNDDLPAPDPSTRVEKNPGSQRRGELIVAAGLGGVLVAVAFVKVFNWAALSALLVAALGTALVLFGAVKRRRSRPELTTDWATADDSVETIAAQDVVKATVADLPSLTGQLGGVLSELRQHHGLAYRTRTWIEELVPAYGGELEDPTLARDLLAAAALDAGGIRADVAGVARSHPRDDIIATGGVLLAALQQVLAACEGCAELAPPPPSDLSTWPASTC